MNTDRNQSVGVRRVKAGEASAGQRLDNFLLRELQGVPRSRVYRLLRRGEVGSTASESRRITGSRPKTKSGCRRCATRHRPSPGRRVFPMHSWPSCGMPSCMKIPGSSCSTSLPDFAVHGGSGLAFGVIEALRACGRTRPSSSCTGSTGIRADASLVARKRAALVSAHALLREGASREDTMPPSSSGAGGSGARRSTRRAHTMQRQGGERVVRVHRGGKIAVSIFDPVAHFRNFATRMDVAIQTGRTHQIRVHAAFAGHPVAGDEKYGNRESNAPLRALGLRRMFLHAASVSFRWPEDGTAFRAEAPLPAEPRSGAREAPAGVRSGLSARERIEARGPRAPGEPDERKPDECSRIARVQGLRRVRFRGPSLRKPPAQSKGRSSLDVAGNFQRRQGAEVDGREIHVLGDGMRLGAAAGRPPCGIRPRLAAAPRRAAARQRSASPGLSRMRSPHTATWSEPMTQAPGCRFADRRGLGMGEPQGPRARALRPVVRLRRHRAPPRRREGRGARGASPGSWEVEARKSGCVMAPRA